MGLDPVGHNELCVAPDAEGKIPQGCYGVGWCACGASVRMRLTSYQCRLDRGAHMLRCLAPVDVCVSFEEHRPWSDTPQLGLVSDLM